MAARAKQWKRRWVEPVCRARCHGDGTCCITRTLKSNPSQRRRRELMDLLRREGRDLERYAKLLR